MNENPYKTRALSDAELIKGGAPVSGHKDTAPDEKTGKSVELAAGSYNPTPEQKRNAYESMKARKIEEIEEDFALKSERPREIVNAGVVASEALSQFVDSGSVFSPAVEEMIKSAKDELRRLRTERGDALNAVSDSEEMFLDSLDSANKKKDESPSPAA